MAPTADTRLYAFKCYSTCTKEAGVMTLVQKGQVHQKGRSGDDGLVKYKSSRKRAQIADEVDAAARNSRSNDT